MDFKRNRLVLGGIFGAIGCLTFLMYSHPLMGVFVLFLGFVSSMRAIWNGAPIIGILLTKATGGMILMYPLLWVAVLKFQEEKARYSEVSPPPQSVPRVDAPRQDSGMKQSVLSGRVGGTKVNSNEIDSPMAMESEGEANPIDAKVLVEKMVRFSREAESGGNLDLVMSQYAESVDYFGTQRSRAEIRIDKEDYWRKWPRRTEEIISDLKVEAKGPDQFFVEFGSSFRNENPATGAWVSADLLNHYTVNLVGEEYVVTAQSCAVSNLKKGEGEKREDKMLSFVNANGQIFEVPESLVQQIERREGQQVSTFELEAVNVVRLTLLAEERRDIQETMSSFAFEVKYFGQDDNHEGIWLDKEAYFKKWPIAEDKLISKYVVQTESGDGAKVTFTTSFRATNAAASETRSGLIDHTFRLKFERGKLRIVEQSGKVRGLKTTKHSK